MSRCHWGRAALVVPYTEHPRDSPVTAVSRAAAEAFGLEWIEAFDWPSGMLVAVCARSGIPAIEPEIGGLECTMPERRALYRACTLNLMRHLGLLPGDPRVPDRVQDVIRAAVAAPVSGVIHRLIELGDWVVAGAPIAAVSDLLGQRQAEVVSPLDGFVAALRLAGSVNPGEQIAVIFAPRSTASSGTPAEDQ